MNGHPGEELLAFLNGEMNEQQRTETANHLAACASCRAELRLLQHAHAALKTWNGPAHAPPSLGERILRDLRAARRPFSRPRELWLRSAAILLLTFAAGFTGYRMAARSTRVEQFVQSDSLPVFLLLLEETRWPSPLTAQRSGYSEWAQTLRQRGEFVGGEKLTDDEGFRVQSNGSVRRPDASERPPNVSGWFLVRAANYNEAIERARLGPHLRYGSVLVRQIE